MDIFQELTRLDIKEENDLILFEMAINNEFRWIEALYYELNEYFNIMEIILVDLSNKRKCIPLSFLNSLRVAVSVIAQQFPLGRHITYSFFDDLMLTTSDIDGIPNYKDNTIFSVWRHSSYKLFVALPVVHENKKLLMRQSY